jgi:phosphoglycerol transferase MdoB-like AlkP superfamily enzyme
VAGAAPIAPARRLAGGAALLVLPLAAALAVDTRQKDVTGHTAANELAGNGIYEFFAAVRNNEIDYAKLYLRDTDEHALAGLRALLETPDAKLVSADLADITRDVVHTGPERRLNVMLITVESLSADFLGVFGDTRGLTPRLDALAQDGLLFTRLYATGTRTVRGLEALALSVPPTPGQSILRRPRNAHLFSLAEVFNERGYDSAFLYGGYGWFDNMNAFFGGNGYRVVDRTAIAPEAIHHENVWGVSDEDLFALALREADRAHAAGRPFFHQLMTTSNHRPFTYPAGRVAIPPGTSREGAVQYTDWAIGHLIDEARRRPWFDDTVFVIVADHTAGGAGKSDLPVARYLIPAIV